jgi:uncharacterized protein YrrD
MRRMSEVVGKAIISADSGDKLGTVSDGLMDNESNALVALVISGGVFGKEHVLPYAEVQTVGGDAILARGATGVLTGKEWRGDGRDTTRSSALKGRAVVTTAGQKIGVVADLMVDDRTGRLESLEVSSSDFAGLLARRSLLPGVADVRIGHDAVIVPVAAAKAIRDDADATLPPGGTPTA